MLHIQTTAKLRGPIVTIVIVIVLVDLPMPMLVWSKGCCNPRCAIYWHCLEFVPYHCYQHPSPRNLRVLAEILPEEAITMVTLDPEGTLLAIHPEDLPAALQDTGLQVMMGMMGRILQW